MFCKVPEAPSHFNSKFGLRAHSSQTSGKFMYFHFLLLSLAKQFQTHLCLKNEPPFCFQIINMQSAAKK